MAAVDRSLVDVIAGAQREYEYEKLSNFRGIPGLSEVLSSIGFSQVKTVPARNGSWLIGQREGYIPFTFVPPKEEQTPMNSGVAIYQSGHGRVRYVFMSKPGNNPSVEELVDNAETISSRIILPQDDRERRVGLVTLGGFIGGSLGGGVSAGILAAGHYVFEWSFGIGATTAFVVSLGVNIVDTLILNHRLTEAVGNMANPDNYQYREKAATQIALEYHLISKEREIDGAYHVATGSGLLMPRKDFQETWQRIKDLERSIMGQNVLKLLEVPHGDMQLVRAAMGQYAQAQHSLGTQQ